MYLLSYYSGYMRHMSKLTVHTGSVVMSGAHKCCEVVQRSIKLIVLTVMEFHYPNNTINGKLLITFISF